MKILLDESLPVRLKSLPWNKHPIFSVRDMGWLGKKNGELIRLMVEHEFDVFVTADRSVSYQQNIASINISIAVLCGVNNRMETYAALIPKLLKLLQEMPLPKVIEVK